MLRKKDVRTSRNKLVPAIEAMEPRQLLSVTLLDGGIVDIDASATNGDRNIHVEVDPNNAAQILVVSNINTYTFAASVVDSVEILGSRGHNTIVVDALLPEINERNVIRGGGIGDTIMGSPGPDIIQSGAGNNLIYGRDGADNISGGAGNDTILGGQGNDTIFGGTGGRNELHGSFGDDQIASGTGKNNDTIFGGPGNDSLNATSSTGNVLIFGGVGNNSLHGGAGVDTLYAGPGASTLVGGSGSDLLVGSTSISLNNAVQVDGQPTLVADGGNDSLTAGPGGATLIGGAGIDTLVGGAGSDLFFQGNAGDSLSGVSGADTVTATRTFTGISPASDVTIHLSILVNINGVLTPVDIPAGAGNIGGNSIAQAVDSNGTIEFRSNTVRTFKLGLFFAQWGVKFSPRNLGQFRAADGRTITMTVNGVANTDFQNFVLPTDNSVDTIQITIN